MADTELAKASVTQNGKPPEQPTTVLAEGDTLHGRLEMKGDGQLLGTFSGEVVCDGELLIGREAKLQANLSCVNLTVAGFVRGNVTASGRLRITSTGRLEGDARVGALIVAEGGVHHGVIRVHPEGLPAAEEVQVVESSPAPAEEPAGPRISASVDRVKKFWGEFF